MTSMNWVSGKENIKVENRLLFEEDIIKAVDKHTKDDNRLDDDISCILEEITSPIQVGSIKIEDKPIQKQRRILLFENENLDLEQRGNKYYLSLYDTIGRFKKEVTIDMKDDILEILSREDCYGNI
jgi:hypothetical protein